MRFTIEFDLAEWFCQVFHKVARRYPQGGTRVVNGRYCSKCGKQRKMITRAESKEDRAFFNGASTAWGMNQKQADAVRLNLL